MLSSATLGVRQNSRRGAAHRIDGDPRQEAAHGDLSRRHVKEVSSRGQQHAAGVSAGPASAALFAATLSLCTPVYSTRGRALLTLSTACEACQLAPHLAGQRRKAVSP